MSLLYTVCANYSRNEPKSLLSRTIAGRRGRSAARHTYLKYTGHHSGLCEVDVRRMKVLREKVHCRSGSGSGHGPPGGWG
eukprot:2332220-Prymnesium_polylepis.1